MAFCTDTVIHLVVPEGARIVRHRNGTREARRLSVKGSFLKMDIMSTSVSKRYRPIQVYCCTLPCLYYASKMPRCPHGWDTNPLDLQLDLLEGGECLYENIFEN